MLPIRPMFKDDPQGSHWLFSISQVSLLFRVTLSGTLP